MTRFSRRSLFQTATAAVAAQAGLQLLSSRFAKTPILAELQRAVLDGDGTALAQAPSSAPKNPLFVFSVHAKWDSAGWINRPNQVSVGVVGNANCGVSEAYPMHGLTIQFGDYLKDIEKTVALGIVPVTTTNGNHDYTGLRATMARTGCLASFANDSMGSMMPLYFSSVGAADGATAVFAAGGQQLITYDNIGGAVDSLLRAIDPLTNMAPEAQTLLTRLNARILQDPKFRSSLEDLAQRLVSAKDPLQAAATRANANPATQLTNDNLMTADVLAANNPFMPQLDTAFSLMDRGLVHAVELSGANSDPNDNGDHNNRGGNNVAFGQRSPNEMKACVAQAIATIYKKYPNALVTFNSDGGRAARGGDTQNYEGIVMGPKSLIKTVFVNAGSRDDSAKFGTNPDAVALSDGTRAAPNQANLMATVAKAAGITLTDTPYIPELLVKPA
jgi:hypothetical protein